MRPSIGLVGSAHSSNKNTKAPEGKSEKNVPKNYKQKHKNKINNIYIYIYILLQFFMLYARKRRVNRAHFVPGKCKAKKLYNFFSELNFAPFYLPGMSLLS